MIKSIKYISLLVSFQLMLTGTLGSQDISIATGFSADSVLIGDQIYYSLRVRQPVGVKISFPVFGDTLVKNIEILEKPAVDTVHTEDGDLLLKQDLLITGFDSGRYVVPGQKFTFEGEGITKEFVTQEEYLQILTMPLDTTQAVFDIKKPYGAPLKFVELIPYLFGLILLALIIFALVYYIRKRKQMAGLIKPKKPLIPPHITAIRELELLKEEKLWQNSREKEYYSRISDIIRVYLEGRYRIFAMEQISDEILDSLLKTGFNDNRLYDKLKTILSISDLAKFAKYRPTPNENESCLLDAYLFVNDTKIEVADTDEDAEKEEKDGAGGGKDNKDKEN